MSRKEACRFCSTNSKGASTAALDESRCGRHHRRASGDCNMRFTTAALVITLASPALAADRAADESDLRTIKTEHWPGFYRKQDVAGLGAFLAPSFVNIAPDGSATARAAELEWLAANPWKAVNFSYTIARIDWHGDDLATITGRGASDRTDAAGRPCRHTYVSSNLLRRTPSAPHGWQALSSHVSGVSCAPVN
jgi:Domain of unknown function (DUF4440)